VANAWWLSFGRSSLSWSVNGGEFINAHLQQYCEAELITFTRSRA
jgi:hypothetical protein